MLLQIIYELLEQQWVGSINEVWGVKEHFTGEGTLVQAQNLRGLFFYPERGGSGVIFSHCYCDEFLS